MKDNHSVSSSDSVTELQHGADTSAPTTEKQNVSKGALIFIFSVVLLDIIGLTLFFLVNAYIVQQYSTSALAVTMLTVIYAAAQFVTAPILGRLSDRYGRRPILLMSVLGSTAGYFMFGLGGALWVLFLSRLIAGITAGNLSVATAYVADVTPPQDRARIFALTGAAFGLGFILGPALGGLLSQVSLAAPILMAGTVSLLNLLFGFFFLPESLPEDSRTVQPLRLSDFNPLASIGDLARRPELGRFLLTQSIVHFAFNGKNGVFTLFALEKFGAQPSQMALVFMAAGIANIMAQVTLIGWLVSKFGEKRLAITGFITQSLLLVATCIAPEFWMLYPITALASAFSGFIFPTLAALIANSVSPHEQGKVSGVSMSLGSLANMLGPLGAGIAYDYITPNTPFWIGAALLILPCFLLIRPTVKS